MGGSSSQKGLPSIKMEVGLVSKVGINTGNRVVNLAGPVLVKAQRGTIESNSANQPCVKKADNASVSIEFLSDPKLSESGGGTRTKLERKETYPRVFGTRLSAPPMKWLDHPSGEETKP